MPASIEAEVDTDVIAPFGAVFRRLSAGSRKTGAKVRVPAHTDEGGAAVVRRVLDMSPLRVHDIAVEGVPFVEVNRFIKAFHLLKRNDVLDTIGISERTFQRAKDPSSRLDSNASDRLLRLAAVTEQAADVLGSQEAAERWLSAGALALNGRRPIDLLQSAEGTEMVKTLLVRLDHGVYA